MPRLRSSLVAFLGFVLVFPFFLRRRPRVDRQVSILAPPETVFALINDLRNWPLWTSWGEEAIAYVYSDSSVGSGAEQRWSTRRMDGVLRLVRSEADSRIDYSLEMAGGKYQMRGRIQLASDGATTRVYWRCVWEAAANPYLRYADLFFQWMIGRDFAEGLSHLQALAEKRHVARHPQTAAPSAPLL